MTAKQKQGTYSSRGQCDRPATTEVSTATCHSGEGKSSVAKKRQSCVLTEPDLKPFASQFPLEGANKISY